MDVTLTGGPYPGRIVELTAPQPIIDVGHPTDVYLVSADPAVYIWTEDAKQQPTADDPGYQAPVPDAVLQAAAIVRQMAHATDADLAVMTTAQERLALRALARALLWVNSRLDEEP